MVKTSKIIATLGVAAGLGVALMPLASYAETPTDMSGQTGSETVEVEIGSYLTFTVAGFNKKVATDAPKVTMEQGATNNDLEHVIHVKGNYNKGYSLTMVANNEGALKGKKTEKTIPSITDGDGGAAVALPEAGTVAAHGHGWGYRYTKNAANSGDLKGSYSAETYNAIPASAKTLKEASSVAVDAFDEDNFVNFGIVTATDEVADIYQSEITYTVTGSSFGA